MDVRGVMLQSLSSRFIGGGGFPPFVRYYSTPRTSIGNISSTTVGYAFSDYDFSKINNLFLKIVDLFFEKLVLRAQKEFDGVQHHNRN